MKNKIQLSLAAPDRDSHYQVAIYSRPQPAAEEEPAPWVQHAAGVLVGGQEPGVVEGLGELAGGAWPPAGARELDSEFLYDRLAEVGYQYGPVFQGLGQAWELDGVVYAEVELPEHQQAEAAGFRVHPALFDAALHASLLAGAESGLGSEPEVPFSFNGVRVYGQGASSMRIALNVERGIDGGASTLSLLALDGEGEALLLARILHAAGTAQLPTWRSVRSAAGRIRRMSISKSRRWCRAPRRWRSRC